jgi:hypothetical protein
MVMAISGAVLVARSELEPRIALVLESIALRHQLPCWRAADLAPASIILIGSSMRLIGRFDSGSASS